MGVARDRHRRCIFIPSSCIRERDIVIALLVIPSTCIRGRDIVVTLLVRVSVCVSPLNS